MNFVDNLALCTGLRFSRPFISDSFFPIVSEKYITIATEGHQSKQWDHFQEFINIINPILSKKGISIVELGANDVKFQGVTSVKGVTEPNHWSYIIKGSLLHVGPENLLSHFASAHDTPQVALFSNTSTDYSAPLWARDTSSQSFICAQLNGNKPSFSGEEFPKSINSIPAESVCSSALALLGIDSPFLGFECLNIGSIYHAPLIEVVPDFVPSADFFPKSLLNLRMDYHFNESSIIHFANNRRITLITDQIINKKIISDAKRAIERIFFKVDQDSDIKYAAHIKSLGVPLSLVAKKECDIQATRLRFFDWKVEEETSITKKDLDNSEKICDTTRYKSSKYLFSKEKKYSSKSSYLKGIESHEDQLIVDDDQFWVESDHFKLYNLNRNDK